MSLESPIFIVGAVRSGTTLFRLILGNHPAIGYAEEHEFGFDELGDHGYPLPRELHELAKTHRQLLARGFEIDKTLSTADLLRDLLRQADERAGKPEVAAVVHSAFHRLPELWPNARYIHILRDPRDVANSCVRMGWAGNAYHGADTWILAQRRWDALCERVPESRRHQVRYEDLVAAPKDIMRGVCEFLGIPYDEVMFDYHEHTTYSEVDSSMAQQWRSKMPPRDALRVEARCGPLVRDRGYETSVAEPSISKPEEAWLLFDHRLHRARNSIDKYGLGLWTMQRVAKYLPSKSLREMLALRQVEIDRQHIK